MDDLIEALQIFRKYENKEWPTHCNHDELLVCIDESKVSKEDIIKLEKLSFMINKESGGFFSHRFGSC